MTGEAGTSCDAIKDLRRLGKKAIKAAGSPPALIEEKRIPRLWVMPQKPKICSSKVLAGRGGANERCASSVFQAETF
eukprot:1142191-Pelagomonas_calceolata.AAC.4